MSGKTQTRQIGTLSDGQRTQLVFCWLAQKNPHMLLFDEPTNHLDMESIDGLAKAINKFQGGMVRALVFRLVSACFYNGLDIVLAPAFGLSFARPASKRRCRRAVPWGLCRSVPRVRSLDLLSNDE